MYSSANDRPGIPSTVEKRTCCEAEYGLILRTDSTPTHKEVAVYQDKQVASEIVKAINVL